MTLLKLLITGTSTLWVNRQKYTTLCYSSAMKALALGQCLEDKIRTLPEHLAAALAYKS